MVTRRDLVAGLLAALRVTGRRDGDPSFVLPRQEAILNAALTSTRLI